MTDSSRLRPFCQAVFYRRAHDERVHAAQVLRRQAEALHGEVQHFVVGIRT